MFPQLKSVLQGLNGRLTAWNQFAWPWWPVSVPTVKYKPHQIPKLKCFSSRFAVASAQSIEARCSVEDEDVVGAAPTGDAPTTSEKSAIILPAKVRLILEVWR